MEKLDGNKLYRLQEVAEFTGIPKTSLAVWARTGQIEATRLGKVWHMTGAQVEKFLRQGTFQQEPEDVLKDIDLREIEIRIADLVEKVTGKPLEDDDRDELLDILETYMRAAITGRTEAPPPVQE